MDIEELQTYIVLANCRNFSKTAELVNVVQSTVSNRIRSLEQYVGETLVVRDKTGIRFTKEGELFLEYAKKICELEKSAITEINMLSTFEDRIDIATVQWMYSYGIQEKLALYTRLHPNIAMNLSIAHGEDIIPMLRNQIVDVGFCSYELNTNSLQSTLISRSRIVLVGEAEQFEDCSNGITMEQLAELPLIYSDIWKNYLSDISGNTLPEWKIFNIRCNMLDSAKEFCLAGSGVCFMPEKIVEKELREGRLVEIPVTGLPEKYVDAYMVCNKNRISSTAMKYWIELFAD